MAHGARGAFFAERREFARLKHFAMSAEVSDVRTRRRKFASAGASERGIARHSRATRARRIPVIAIRIIPAVCKPIAILRDGIRDDRVNLRDLKLRARARIRARCGAPPPRRCLLRRGGTRARGGGGAGGRGRVQSWRARSLARPLARVRARGRRGGRGGGGSGARERECAKGRADAPPASSHPQPGGA